MADLVEIDGLHWPRADIVCRPIALSEVGPAMAWLQHHNKRWGTIIQAGGNGGVYPIALAPLFHTVMTYEPDPTSYRALRINTQHLGNVLPFWGALGDTSGLCSIIEPEPGNIGANRVEMAAQGSPVYRLDKLMTRPDVIWLDIEGYELQAIKGAAETIARSRPLIILELKRLGRFYGYTDDDVRDHLTGLGYAYKDKHGNDEMWEPA